MSQEILSRLDELGKSIQTDTGALRERMAELEARQNAQAEKVVERKGPGSRVIRNVDDLSRRSLRLDMTPSDVSRYSISRLYRAVALGRTEEEVKRRAPFEFDVHVETMKANAEEYERRQREEQSQVRTMTTLDSTGGFLIPEVVAQQFYPTFYGSTVMDKTNWTTMSGLTSFPLRVNKQTSSTTAYYHGETVAATASDIAVGQVNLMPHKLSVFNKTSLEDVKFTSPAIDSLLMSDMMQKLALRANLAAFEGTGASSQPLGILNTTSTTRTQVNSGSPATLTWDDMITLEGALEDADALIDDGSLFYVGRPDVLRKMITTSTTSFTFGPSAYRIIGGNKYGAPWPVVTTTNLSTNLSSPSGGDYLVFGHFADCVHALWGGMELKRSDVASDGTNYAFTEDMIFVKVSMWHDVACIRQAAVTYADDVAN